MKEIMTSSSSLSTNNNLSSVSPGSASSFQPQQLLLGRDSNSNNIQGVSGSLQGNTTPTSSSNSSVVPPTPPRRTRHRVDAGEPRGCFNNSNSSNSSLNSFYTQHQQSLYSNNLNPSLSYPAPSSSLLHSLEHSTKSLHPLTQHNHHNFLGSGPSSSTITSSSSSSAAAAAAAASLALCSSLISPQHQDSTPLPSYRHPYHNLQQQLLLREMLQQQQHHHTAQTSYNNNNNIIKSLKDMKYESSTNTLLHNNNNNNNNSGEESSSERELLAESTLLPNNKKLISNLGCKKRKLYQPVRNGSETNGTDLDKDEEPEVHSSSLQIIPSFSPSHHHNSHRRSISPLPNKSPVNNNGQNSWNNNNNKTQHLINSLRKSPMHSHSHSAIHHRRSSSPPPAPPRDLVMSSPGLLSPTHPNLTIAQWKDQFKSTLMSSINDLVENQFSLLINAVSSNTNVNTNAPSPDTNNLKSNRRALPPTPPPPRQPSQPQQPQGIPNAQQGPIIAPITLQQRFPYHHRLLPGGGSIPPPYYPTPASLLNYNSDTDSPLSLVVTPKKKRHKVTDTRLTPRAVSRLLDNGNGLLGGSSTPNGGFDSPPPTHHYFNGGRLADSPPASLNEFVQSQIGAGGGAGSSEFGGGSDGGDSPRAGSCDGSGTGSYTTTGGSGFNCGTSSTLTPMHLRKAKLMFFWVRYPSSSVLKMYFPDIKFNKNNTAQLVKWFSNFREFYYIQMEKFARQALSEGVKCSDELHISVDHELYRSLNMHYNRNNHIDVPSNFRYVVEQTLREFFKAIQTGKDSEQSWKKAIYKIIARLDDPVPEYFKSPNFLEKLE